MNPLVKIISAVIIAINRLIDSIEPRMVDSIRQGFYFFVTLLLIAGIFIGYQSGKKAARKGGKQIAEFTNNAFDVTIRKERRDGTFRTMLDSELLKEVRESKSEKIRFPSGEALEPEFKTELIEPDTSERKLTPPVPDTRDRLSEIDRTEMKKEIPEVRNLKRREPSDTANPPGIIKDDKSGNILRHLPEESLEKTPSAGIDKKVTTDNKPGSVKKKSRPKRELKPLEINPGVLEK